MKINKYKLKNIIKSMCLLIIVLLSFIYWSQKNKFSKSKWHNGFQEEIIYDVMDNYVYPGVPLTDVLDNLAAGIEVDENTKNKYLSLFDLDDTVHDVLIYQIKNIYNDFDGIYNSYYVVIHDGEVVTKTLFIKTLS